MNWAPKPFSPDIIRFTDDVQFCKTTGNFFHFTKVTVKGCKAEFNSWLKEYWSSFSSETFEELCLKINPALSYD
jgi:hypothetical protein